MRVGSIYYILISYRHVELLSTSLLKLKRQDCHEEAPLVAAEYGDLVRGPQEVRPVWIVVSWP